MPVYTVSSIDYASALGGFVSKRLRGSLAASAFYNGNGSVFVNAEPEQLPLLARAAAEFAVLDLRVPETARLVSLLPLERRDMACVLPLALQHEDGAWLSAAEEAFLNYFRSNTNVVIEGFLRFRLQSITDDWAVSVDRAGQELLLKREYIELMSILNAYANSDIGVSDQRCVRLILHSDGSATISDGRDFRAESACAEGPELIGLLIGLAPDSVEVYDLTGEGRPGLLLAVKSVFGGKARLFTVMGRR